MNPWPTQHRRNQRSRRLVRGGFILNLLTVLRRVRSRRKLFSCNVRSSFVLFVVESPKIPFAKCNCGASWSSQVQGDFGPLVKNSSFRTEIWRWYLNMIFVVCRWCSWKCLFSFICLCCTRIQIVRIISGVCVQDVAASSTHPIAVPAENTNEQLCRILFVKRVVPKGRYHTLSVITISLHVCMCVWMLRWGGGVNSTWWNFAWVIFRLL